MIDFLRKMLALVRPYRTRLILGLACGVIFGLTNGALMVLVQLVIDLVFNGAKELAAADPLRNVPGFLRPAFDGVLDLISRVHGPNSQAGKVMLILTLPLLMTIRCLADYLSTYLTSWAAVRAIADLRTR